MPHRRCPGRDGMSTLASGSSVMKMGYMNMDLLSWQRLCHDLGRGWWNPPWRIEAMVYAVM